MYVRILKNCLCLSYSRQVQCEDKATERTCFSACQNVKAVQQFQGIFVFPFSKAEECHTFYVVGSKSFRSDIQKPLQKENAVRDIEYHL